MKISKLFHWLYGVIMLLPIFAIGVTCLYVVLNENAKDSFSSNTSYNYEEINYKYESNELTWDTENLQWNGFVEGNIYLATFNINFNLNNEQYNVAFFNENGEDETTYCEVISYEGSAVCNFLGYDKTQVSSIYYNPEWWQSTQNIFTINDINGNKFNLMSSGTLTTQYRNVRVKVIFVFSNENLFNNILSDEHNLYEQCPQHLIPYETQEISQDIDTLDNVFYISIDKVQQSPLFNWAYNSFLVAPFAYIVALFSMPTNSFVVMLLSYWLAISIIWLVFDLIMYVPLLTHRWIDKGIIE